MFNMIITPSTPPYHKSGLPLFSIDYSRSSVLTIEKDLLIRSTSCLSQKKSVSDKIKVQSKITGRPYQTGLNLLLLNLRTDAHLTLAPLHITMKGGLCLGGRRRVKTDLEQASVVWSVRQAIEVLLDCCKPIK